MLSLIRPLALRLTLVLVASGAVFAQPVPPPAGLWEFDDASQLVKAAVGGNLTISGTPPVHHASLADDLAGSQSGVITTAGGTANHLRMPNPTGANGGGNFTNEYTFLFDIFSPAGSRSSWRSLFQTNTGNSNDAEYFIRNSDDRIGIASPLGYSTNPLPENRWVRLVLVFDVNASGTASSVRAYVDGSLFHTHSFTGGRDGSYGLEPTVLLFADNNNENAALNVGTVGFWGKLLTATEVSALGTAGTPFGGNQPPVIAGGGSIALPQAVKNGAAVGTTLQVTDAENDAIAWSVSRMAANGTAVISASGNTHATIEYTPAPGFSGTDTFQVSAADAGGSDTIEVTVFVKDPAANQAPAITEGETLALPQAFRNGSAVSATVHATDPENDPITWSVSTAPSNGSVILTETTGDETTIHYTPATGFTGTDTFTVRAADSDGAHDEINVTVSVVNSGLPSPIGLWQFDHSFDPTLATLGNDLSMSGSGFSGAQGTGTGDGAILVSSGSHFLVDHGIPANGGGTRVNEYTLLYDILLPSNGWKALLQTDTTNASDAEIFINTSNQIGGQSVLGGYSSSSLSNNTWHRVVITVDNGSARRIYVNGQQWYQGTAGTIDNDRHALSPQFLIFADEDGEDGPIRVTNFAVWSSALTATQVQALGNTSTAISDAPPPVPNHPPVITEGSAITVNAGKSVPTPIQLHASDPDSDPLTWSLSRQPANGSVLLSPGANGSLTTTYTSSATFIGTDSFGMTVSDGRKSTAINVTVNVVNSPPVINEGESYLLSAVLNGGVRTASFSATDPNGNTLNWTISSQPQHGIAAISPAEGPEVEVSYTPATGYSGPDSFVVTVSDGLESDNILVTVSVVDPQADPVLTVISPFGEPQPPAGANPFSSGTALSPAVADVIGPDSRHFVTGWSMTGDGPSEGSGSTFNTTLTRDSTLTWLWKTEHRLQFSVSGNGGIDKESGWHDAGLPLQVTATPQPGHFFSGWSGDTDGCSIGGKTIVIPMDRPRSTITANFTPNSNFTVIALPDTQNYTSISSPTDTFTRQTQWIKDNKETLNIRFVTHLGDIVNSPTSTSQWTRATDAMNVLNSFLPYGTCPGNHDLATGSNHYIERFGPNPTHNSSLGRWVDPGTGQRYSWYGGSSPRGYSSYQIIPVDGREFLFLHLDMDCPNEDLIWAASVLEANPRTLTTITTHNYLAETGGGGAYGSGTGQRGYTAQANISVAPARNRPETIFNTLVKPYNQVFMVICGHNFAIYNLEKTNDAGNIVHEVLCDYQSLPNGGNGFLRIMDFRPSENKIYNTTFSPTLGRYINPSLAADRQGMLDLHDPNGGEFAIDLDFDHRFDSNLTIASAHSSVTPAIGTHRYSDGTPVVVSAGERVEGQTRYRPTGWLLTGGQTLSGSGSSATIIHKGNSTLTWNWSAEHRLETSVIGDGIVSIGGSWQTAGTNVTVVAQPDPGASFIQWSGDISGCTIQGNRITVPIDRPRGPVTAEFSSSVPVFPVQIVSDYPSTSPAPATYSYESGSVITLSAVDFTDGGTRRICNGYTLSGATTGSGSGNQVTLTVTGATTVTWHWKTQYLVTAQANGPGNVSPESVWAEEGATVTLTGSPETGALVASWTGDTAAGTPAGNLFQISSVTRPVGPVVANFAVGMHTLTIVSPHGTVTPAPGAVNLPYGTVVQFSAVPSVGDGTRAVPSGWTLEGATSSSGETTSGSFVVDSDITFTWAWDDEVYLALSAGFEGKVHPLGAGGWKKKGSSISLSAEPASGFRFVKWAGEVPENSTSPALTLLMDEPRAVTADATPLATASGTPHWWLDRHSEVVGGDYEAADVTDADKDGKTARQEFLAGTSDRDPQRHFHIEQILKTDAEGPHLDLVWQSAFHRNYYLFGSPDLVSPFSELSGPYPGDLPTTSLQIPLPGEARYFYRIEARLSPGGPLDGDSLALSPEPAPDSLIRNTRRIPAGWFKIGEDSGGQDTRPAHQNWVPGLEMDKFEVTRSDWEKVAVWAAPRGYDLPVSLPFEATPDEPAVALSWYSAVKWCNARSEMEGRVPCYYSDTEGTVVYRAGEIDLTSRHVNWAGNGYRLPTEAEWERASRGGLESKRFPWGDDPGDYRANHWNYQLFTGRAPHTPYPYLQKVGYFDGTQPGGGADSSNAYGLYDMVGNAWEWTWNRMESYTSDPKVAHTGPDTGEFRVLRGGSWWMYLDHATNFQRLAFPPDGTDDYGMLGFRVVRGLNPNEVREEE